MAANSDSLCSVIAINRKTVDKVLSRLPEIEQTAEMSDFFKVLADPTRLQIVQALTLEELCVCDLSAIVNVSVSAISHQLRLLRNMKIVKNRKTGKMVYYSLDDDHINRLINVARKHVLEE